LSPRDVLALDPTDGTAWLAQAAVQPDQRDALLRAATAPGLRFRDWGDALPEVVAAAMPEGLPAYLQVDLHVLSLGIEAARPDPPGWQLLMHCRGKALEARELRALCQSVAQALTERSDSFSSLFAGAALARNLGWPAAELARLNDEAAQALRVLEASFDAAQPYTCASVSALRNLVRDRARWGDLGVARRLSAAQTAGAPEPAR
jgi:hypothetical protein